jgi:putative transposase
VGISKQAHAQNQVGLLRVHVHQKDILQAVARIRVLHPMMGLKKIYHKLKPITLGRDQFISLAQSANLGIEKTKNYRRTTFSTKSNRYKNLLGDILLDGINQVWVSDITYFWVVDRFYYITLIMDLYSRKIVGYQAAVSLVATANVAALNMAIECRKSHNLQGLKHHSDKGTQYVFKAYTDILESIKAQISMCNIVYENTHSERLNGIIKGEYLEQRNINNFEQLKRHLTNDVKLYNEDRPHWELDMMTPVEYENSILKIAENQRTKMKIYVDPDTIRKQKFANQLVLF